MHPPSQKGSSTLSFPISLQVDDGPALLWPCRCQLQTRRSWRVHCQPGLPQWPKAVHEVQVVQDQHRDIEEEQVDVPQTVSEFLLLSLRPFLCATVSLRQAAEVKPDELNGRIGQQVLLQSSQLGTIFVWLREAIPIMADSTVLFSELSYAGERQLNGLCHQNTLPLHILHLLEGIQVQDHITGHEAEGVLDAHFRQRRSDPQGITRSKPSRLPGQAPCRGRHLDANRARCFCEVCMARHMHTLGPSEPVHNRDFVLRSQWPVNWKILIIKTGFERDPDRSCWSSTRGRLGH
mmetsp:Transcript_31835/g.74388  ORF Transcript_31835/g.74388 Transcript_31835/m.74388 type:complete len:292 (-) Transcript_31835:786-1661(-)